MRIVTLANDGTQEAIESLSTVLAGTGLPPDPTGYADGTLYIRQVNAGAVSKADFLRYAFLLSPNGLPPATDGFFAPGATNYDSYMVAAGVAGHYALTGLFAASGTMYGSPAAANGKVRIGSSIWQRLVQHALPNEAAFTDLIGQGQTVVLLHNVVRSTLADTYAAVARNGYTSSASSFNGHLTVGAITYYSATDQKIYHGMLDTWQEVPLPEIVERYILANGEWHPLTGAQGPQGEQGVQGVVGPQGEQGIPGPAGSVAPKTFPTSENLAAGDLVNIYDNAGTPTARKADAATPGKEAHGFVSAATTSPANAEVYYLGIITGLTGLAGGPKMYLAANGAVTATPSNTSGYIYQAVGVRSSATEILFQPELPVVLS